VIFRGVSIALLPFWRFDAKGGEVVLLGFVDLQGSGASTCLSVVLFACLCLFSVNLFVICTWLCKTMSCFTLRVSYCGIPDIYSGSHGILDLSMEPI
jgi:hypothetical protein